MTLEVTTTLMPRSRITLSELRAQRAARRESREARELARMVASASSSASSTHRRASRSPILRKRLTGSLCLLMSICTWADGRYDAALEHDEDDVGDENIVIVSLQLGASLHILPLYPGYA